MTNIMSQQEAVIAGKKYAEKQQENYKKFLSDYWYEIADNWDIKLHVVGDRKDETVKIVATIYPAYEWIDGYRHVNTDETYDVWEKTVPKTKVFTWL